MSKRERIASLLRTPAGQNLARGVLLFAVLAVWQWGISAGLRFWLSSPAKIAEKLGSWIADGSLWGHLGATLLVMSLGYTIGCIFGILVGLLLAFLPRTRQILAPYLSALNALPKIALAPLFIIFLGIGITSKVALVAVTVFFLLYSSTSDGIANIDLDLTRTLRLMGATRVEVIRKVMIPASFPWIFSGMRIAVRYAFTNALLAELISANSGLGYLIEFYSGNFDSSGAYAAIAVLVVISVAITEILTRIEQRFRNLPRDFPA
jgi:NitT/TauT family transport system permease protein